MICDLLIDGNYILNKNTFALHKNNLLFGALLKSLEISISNYRKWYSFANVYLVSDSREKSWRKKLLNEYKGKRKPDPGIDWSFVMETYGQFKESLQLNTKVKVLEAPHIEGDDWISFVTNEANKNGRSTIIISNDYDIKQLIKYSVNPTYINIMSNEIQNKQKLFLPKNFQIFLNDVNKMNNDDIFNLNDNHDFLRLIESLIERYEAIEIDPLESLMLKVVSGDKSDNISSVYFTIKNNKKYGIGEKGAKTIYEMYGQEFGELKLNDTDLYENIADLVCEKKKLSKSLINSIRNNIDANMKLIHLDLDNLPKPVVNKMSEIYAGL